MFTKTPNPNNITMTWTFLNIYVAVNAFYFGKINRLFEIPCKEHCSEMKLKTNLLSDCAEHVQTATEVLSFSFVKLKKKI